MVMRRNVTVIKYLINMFLRMSTRYNKSDLVKVYKVQARDFCNTLDNSVVYRDSIESDLSLVYSILGIKNTDNIKLDITMNKLNMIVYGMTNINNLISMGMGDNQIKEKLRQELNMGAINDSAYRALIAIYRLNDKGIKVKVNVNKSINTKTRVNNKSSDMKEFDSNSIMGNLMEKLSALNRYVQQCSLFTDKYKIWERLVREEILLNFTDLEIYDIAKANKNNSNEFYLNLVIRYLYLIDTTYSKRAEKSREYFKNIPFPTFESIAYIRRSIEDTREYDPCYGNKYKYIKAKTGDQLDTLRDQLVYKVKQDSDPCRGTRYEYYTLDQLVKYLIYTDINNIVNFVQKLCSD